MAISYIVGCERRAQQLGLGFRLGYGAAVVQITSLIQIALAYLNDILYVSRGHDNPQQMDTFIVLKPASLSQLACAWA